MPLLVHLSGAVYSYGLVVWMPSLVYLSGTVYTCGLVVWMPCLVYVPCLKPHTLVVYFFGCHLWCTLSGTEYTCGLVVWMPSLLSLVWSHGELGLV